MQAINTPTTAERGYKSSKLITQSWNTQLLAWVNLVRVAQHGAIGFKNHWVFASIAVIFFSNGAQCVATHHVMEL